MNFAWLIVMTPLGVIGMAISTAAFPTLAEQAARRRPRLRDDARECAAARSSSSPSRSASRLVFLAPLIVTVLLQRAPSTVGSTELTSQALTFYALAVPAHSAIEIISRGFYVLGDTRTPVAVAVGAMLLNLALAAMRCAEPPTAVSG